MRLTPILCIPMDSPRLAQRLDQTRGNARGFEIEGIGKIATLQRVPIPLPVSFAYNLIIRCQLASVWASLCCIGLPLFIRPGVIFSDTVAVLLERCSHPLNIVPWIEPDAHVIVRVFVFVNLVQIEPLAQLLNAGAAHIEHKHNLRNTAATRAISFAHLSY